MSVQVLLDDNISTNIFHIQVSRHLVVLKTLNISAKNKADDLILQNVQEASADLCPPDVADECEEEDDASKTMDVCGRQELKYVDNNLGGRERSEVDSSRALVTTNTSHSIGCHPPVHWQVT